MKDIINLDQYNQHGDGPGAVSAADVALLNKALEVGHLRGGDPSATSGGSLKVESLEKTLKYLQYKEGDMALWQLIKKFPAYSTVEEYERVTGYGSEQGGFIGEGELPEETDGTYERAAELVKYLGNTRAVTHQAQLVTTNVGNLFAHQAKLGTLWILKKADKALAWGDASVVPVEWNGFYTQHRKAFTTLNEWQDSDVVIDLRNGYLKEEHIEQAAEAIIENHGSPDTLMAPPVVLSNFVKQFHASKLIYPNSQMVAAGIMGQRVVAFDSQFGRVSLGWDKFLKAGTIRKTTDNATHVKAPVAIVPDGTTPLAAVSDTAGTRFANFLGDYFYAVAAVNRYGESVLKELSTSKVTVGANQSVACKFTAGSGTYAATGFIIYRSAKNEAAAYNVCNYYPLFAISTAELTAGYDGGAAGIVWDRNRIIGNTQRAFLIENDGDQVWSFKQLAPLMKMDLARLSTADRFMVLLYGTPQLYAPRKKVIFLNVGAYVAS